MSELSILVQKYFPNNKIIKDVYVEFSTSLDTVFGKSLKDIFDSGPLAIPMVETDSMYFFDIRPIYYSYKPWIRKLNPLNILISLFVLIFGGYIIIGIFSDLVRNPTPFGIFMAVVFFGAMPFIFRQNKTIVNILVVKKDWVTNRKNIGDKQIITWSMPRNVYSFSFVHLLTEEAKGKLPFFIKLQGGLLFKKFYDFWLRKSSFIKYENVEFIFQEVKAL